MRLLVTGVSGLLGLNLALHAQNQHTVTGVDRCQLESVPFELLCADLLDKGATERIIETLHTDWLIHCAALANPEACESDPSLANVVNAELPGALAAVCRKCGIKMLHISTDSVFDGKKETLYTEDDLPNPQGVYAATKLAGEQNVLSSNSKAIVARTNFYGWSVSGKRSISEFFYNNLSAGRVCSGFNDVWFSPLFVGDLADVLLQMLEKDLAGLYHVVGPEALTKYEFGVRLAHRFDFDANLIHPISVEESDLKAKRPHTLRLSGNKLSAALGAPLPSFSNGLDQFYAQYKDGYPQKIQSYQKAAMS